MTLDGSVLGDVFFGPGNDIKRETAPAGLSNILATSLLPTNSAGFSQTLCLLLGL